MSTYTKRVSNKHVFKSQVFEKFTDACGGYAQDFADLLYTRFTVECFTFSDDFYFHQTLQYFKDKVIPHKIAVYQSGLELSRLGIFDSDDKELFLENLWIHDMSKFSANESIGYAFHDFSKKEYSLPFEKAWHHHKQHNPHHPEYWMNPGRNGKLDILPMTELYVAEMITDWMGAGRTYGNSLEDWLPDNIFKFVWHQDTAIIVQTLLSKIGIKTKIEGEKLYT